MKEQVTDLSDPDNPKTTVHDIAPPDPRDAANENLPAAPAKGFGGPTGKEIFA